MNDISQQIYTSIQDAIKGKRAVLAWSGGPWSSLLWWIAYRDLGLKLPIVFIDTGDHPVRLYSLIASIKNQYNLSVETIICEKGEFEKEIKKLTVKYDIVLTGKQLEIEKTYAPFDQSQEVWNLLKTLGVPFLKQKRTMLGGKPNEKSKN